MKLIQHLFGLAAILWCGACFGIFLAWTCTVMWGLDAADPRVSIPAMQAMNTNVQNGVFGVVFFGAPLVTLVACGHAFLTRRVKVGVLYLSAALVLAFGMIGFTMAFLLPLNDGFASLPTPGNLIEATRLWSAYADPWQQLNIARTAFCGVAFALTGLAALAR